MTLEQNKPVFYVGKVWVLIQTLSKIFLTENSKLGLPKFILIDPSLVFAIKTRGNTSRTDLGNPGHNMQIFD
jgi:hypothetical protein